MFAHPYTRVWPILVALFWALVDATKTRLNRSTNTKPKGTTQ